MAEEADMLPVLYRKSGQELPINPKINIISHVILNPPASENLLRSRALFEDEIQELVRNLEKQIRELQEENLKLAKQIKAKEEKMKTMNKANLILSSKLKEQEEETINLKKKLSKLKLCTGLISAELQGPPFA